MHDIKKLDRVKPTPRKSADIGNNDAISAYFC